MKVKLDENLGLRGRRLLEAAGWDVVTVVDQDMCGAQDRALIEVCRAEGRVIVSMDRDFSNTVLFPPRRYQGIVVLRLPEPIRLEEIEGALERLVSAAAGVDLTGVLWIVDHRRIREFKADDGA